VLFREKALDTAARSRSLLPTTCVSQNSASASSTLETLHLKQLDTGCGLQGVFTSITLPQTRASEMRVEDKCWKHTAESGSQNNSPPPAPSLGSHVHQVASGVPDQARDAGTVGVGQTHARPPQPVPASAESPRRRRSPHILAPPPLPFPLPLAHCSPSQGRGGLRERVAEG